MNINPKDNKYLLTPLTGMILRCRSSRSRFLPMFIYTHMYSYKLTLLNRILNVLVLINLNKRTQVKFYI